jgi:hypothetical protein
MLGPNQCRILAALADTPAGILANVLLSRIAPGATPAERAKLLTALRRLENAGLVTVTGKRSRTEVAGALVTRSLRCVMHPDKVEQCAAF